MPIIELITQAARRSEIKGKIVANLPDENGVYETSAGNLSITILSTDQYGIRKMLLTGEALKSVKPHGRRDNPARTKKEVALGMGGWGSVSMTRGAELVVVLQDSGAARSIYKKPENSAVGRERVCRNIHGL